MKIQELRINHYGKLQNKNIKFGDNINLIYGKNESGKSTMLSYIINSLYGISKNKKGKEYSDYEKYEPWVGEEFSGKLIYKLDNGKTFEIYRDFKKKNPKIFNENKEEISKEFPIDKTLGNMFFYEQTKIDEELYLSTLISNQQETKLQKNDQEKLVQKIANLVGTGEDKISYKLAIDRINRRQLEEIGSARTREKPINLIERKLSELENKKKQLEEYKNKQYETEEKENEIINQIKKEEEELNFIQEYKILYEKYELENQQKTIQENTKKQNNEKIREIDSRLDSIQKENKEKLEKNRKKTIDYKKIPIILLIIMLILVNIYMKKIIILIFSIIILLGTSTILICKYTKNQKAKKNQHEILKEKINLLQKEIEILEKNNKKIDEEIHEFEEQMQKNLQNERKKLFEKYPHIEKDQNETISKENLLYKIQLIQNNINNKKVKLHTLELDKNVITPNLEKLANMEEEICNLQEQKKELQKLNTAIEITKQILEQSYETMKHTITPKFTQNLSNNISKITNGKYNNVRFNDETGLIVENENGEYIPAKKLSIGTIEQLYLSLRLSMIDEISDEKLPIILDESFAYFDADRLKNFLMYIYEIYSDRQIILLTCTNREKEVLDENEIMYKYIEI